ncbi:cell division protein FtsQ [bacterium BMS3Bbin12]|nr:cell division protein FtsQ [bacterium BMS3Abin12]GBE48531.1 cell division protein FtsQ [bacterium BMS3Bbin12]GBE51518.1 cell division protein FtsQ [bacterium BMS3Bbin13]HDJ85761.1 FtsQ-type POTRA domain-containing protein [Chromatiales bacterium]HDK02353.1 FtsQ-type POTRA domain-containing protein [Gammaproteobacteria bacterium]
MAGVITIPLGGARRRRAAGASATARRGLRVGVVCAVLALAAWAGLRGWDGLRDPRLFPVRRVQIAGTFHHLSPSRLKAVLGGVISGSFFTVNIQAVRAAADALPWVRSATVRRVWPATLVVHVLERVPFARWGTDALMSAGGTVFHPREIGDLPGLPELHGPAGTGVLVLRRYREYAPLLAALGLRLRRLNLDARRSWRMELAGGLRIRLGRGHPTRRLKRFLSVYPVAFAGRVHDIQTVDLRYTNGFAVRWKPSAVAFAGAGRG